MTRKLSFWDHIVGIGRHIVGWIASNPKAAAWVLGAIVPVVGTGTTFFATKSFTRPIAANDTALVHAVEDLKSDLREELKKSSDALAGKIDTANLKIDRTTLALKHLRGGERAMRKALEQEALDKAWRTGRTAPFDPSTGFTEEVLSGKTPMFGGAN